MTNSLDGLIRTVDRRTKGQNLNKSIEIERVEMSEGFDVNGTWHQMSGDVLPRITSTLFWAPTPHRLWTHLIHHNATMLSLQQNIDKTLISFSSVSSAETNYFWQQNTCQKLKA